MADLIEWVKVENPKPPAIEAYKVYLNYEDEKYFSQKWKLLDLMSLITSGTKV